MWQMRARRWAVTLITVVAAAACAGQASYTAVPAPPPPAAEAGPISGTVVDADGKPVPGQIVAIGGERTTSDGEGRFSFRSRTRRRPYSMHPCSPAMLPATPPLWMLLVLPPLLFCTEFVWYAVVAVAFSSRGPRSLYLRSKSWIDRAAGAVVGALGAKLMYDGIEASR